MYKSWLIGTLDYQIMRTHASRTTMSNAYAPLAIGVMGMLAISIMTTLTAILR